MIVEYRKNTWLNFVIIFMILLTGASIDQNFFFLFFGSGQIGYALVPMIARGVMLGADQPVILHMLDIPPAAEALNGVKMELVDAAFPLLKGLLILLNFYF